jgi:DsbC/DsbD-like thiol-disulfide interchange protein
MRGKIVTGAPGAKDQRKSRQVHWRFPEQGGNWAPQDPIGARELISARVRLATAVLAIVAAAGAAAQTPDPKARVQFVAAGNLAPDGYRAAILIELSPDTITYWRNPGEAGVPPTFDFSGSDNLARAEVALPAPTRINEAGGDVFGYTKRVAYAATIEPKDPAKPVNAVLKMDYAACEKICVPMHAEARLELAPSGKPGPDAAVVAAAEAALPRKLPQAEAASVTRVAGADKPTWRIAPKSAGATDLFAEAPDGFFFETGREPDGGFRLALVEAPKGAAPPAAARLTMTTQKGAVEFEARLDGKPAAP